MSETNIIEYKTTWKDDFLKVVCAFANSEGGTLFIGMDDHGKPVGLKNEKKLLEDLPNKINSKLGIVAEVKPEAKKGNNVISIKVMPSSVPISWQGRYFQRSGSVVLELNGKQLSDFLLKKSGLTWDAIEMEGVGTEGLDTDTIDKFKVQILDWLSMCILRIIVVFRILFSSFKRRWFLCMVLCSTALDENALKNFTSLNVTSTKEK